MGKFNNIKQTPLVKPIGSDAFGRLTVAQPQTLFDSKLLHDKMPLFWDEQITNTSGNATSTHLDVQVQPIGNSFLIETADNIQWLLMVNPTIAGTFTYSGVNNSAAEVAYGATANVITDDSWDALIDSGFVIASGTGNNARGTGGGLLNLTLYLGSQIDGTPDEFVLAVRPFSGAAEVQASLTYQEL